jgi:hypothetical protein
LKRKEHEATPEEELKESGYEVEGAQVAQKKL